MHTQIGFQTRKWSVGVVLLIGAVTCGVLGLPYGNNGIGRDAGYITAIEDRTTLPPGFMVMTGDYSYAIYSPRLAVIGWQSITVNGAQVVIVTKERTALVTGLFDLGEHERDLIAEIRGEFIQNLAGLKLTHSPGSLFLNKQTFDPALLGGSDLSYAGNAISLLKNLLYLTGSPHSPRYGVFGGGDDEKGLRQTPPGELSLRLSEDTVASSERSARKSDPSSGQQQDKNETASDARSYSYRPSSGLGSGGGGGGGYSYGSRYSFVPASRRYQQNYCSRRTASNFNFYNLNQAPLLAKSLLGDVYNFDLRCNILDVYSSTVSIAQQSGVSVLYRDQHHFAYSRANLPAHIHRFFLVGDSVFFVYTDGSLLLKENWLLEPFELNLVVDTRRQLRVAAGWQAKLEASASSPAGGDDATESAATSDAANRETSSSEERAGSSNEPTTTTKTAAKTTTTAAASDGPGQSEGSNQTAEDKQ